jgi:hypothetical protein
MCIAYLFYYPAKTIFDRGPWVCGFGVPINVCNATVLSSEYTLSDDNTIAETTLYQRLDFFERTFGISTSDQCMLMNPINNTSTSGMPGVISSTCMYILLSCGLIVWMMVPVSFM